MPAIRPAARPFALVISDLAPDDDPSLVAHLAAELDQIISNANRCAAAARSTSPSGACSSCSGIGAAVGECATCHGHGHLT